MFSKDGCRHFFGHWALLCPGERQIWHLWARFTRAFAQSPMSKRQPYTHVHIWSLVLHVDPLIECCHLAVRGLFVLHWHVPHDLQVPLRPRLNPFKHLGVTVRSRLSDPARTTSSAPSLLNHFLSKLALELVELEVLCYCPPGPKGRHP